MEEVTSSAAITVDARGKPCPLPILELARALRPLQAGQTVRLLATDPGVKPDLSAFCLSTGHALVSLEEREGAIVALLRKART